MAQNRVLTHPLACPGLTGPSPLSRCSGPQAWKRLVEPVSTLEPYSPVAFLHRDYHPGNLLWDGGQMAGIVDWACACHGPTAVDVADTECNLMLIDGSEAAERSCSSTRRRIGLVCTRPMVGRSRAADLGRGILGSDGLQCLRSRAASGTLLRSRADRFAETVCRHAEGAAQRAWATGPMISVVRWWRDPARLKEERVEIETRSVSDVSCEESYDSDVGLSIQDGSSARSGQPRKATNLRWTLPDALGYLEDAPAAFNIARSEPGTSSKLNRRIEVTRR